MNHIDHYRAHQQHRAFDALPPTGHTPIPLSDEIDGVDERVAVDVPDCETATEPRQVRVRFEELDELPIEKMLTVDPVPEYGLPAGHQMGFRCQLCGTSDESLREVEHHPKCDLKETFDYEAHDGSFEVFREVIRADHDLLLLVADESGGTDRLVDGGRYLNGQPVHLWCAECCSGDDSVDEIEHSEVCSLSRRRLLDRCEGHAGASGAAGHAAQSGD